MWSNLKGFVTILQTPHLISFMPPQDGDETEWQDRRSGNDFVNELIDDKIKKSERRSQEHSRYYTDTRVNEVNKKLQQLAKISAANHAETKKTLVSHDRRISNGIDLPKLFRRFVFTSKIEMLAILILAFVIYHYFF